jgi:hypothetical protein
MNLKVSSGLAALVAVLILPSNESLEAYIYFENTRFIDKPAGAIATPSRSKPTDLIQSLERITCLSLEIDDNYLKVYEPPKSLYASIAAIYRLDDAVPADRRCSATAKELLLSALREMSVYRVRENQSASLARVTSTHFIELDFKDVAQIIYRDIPKESFDIGMIFLHELAHRHLRLTDPDEASIKKNSLIKGDTVAFINRIERELNLPQRRHYAPVKIRRANNEIKWGIYYGSGTNRVELDPKFGLR